MDWITHSATGFFLGQVIVKPDERPRRAGWWWVIASICPDWLEFGTRWFGDIHRGVTHSLYMWPLLALAWAVAARRWGRNTSGQAASMARLWAAFFVVIGSHLVLDALMSYRLYLAWPFSQTNIAFGIMPFYDVYIFSAWLILLAVHYFRRLPSLRTAQLGLVIVLLFLSIRGAGKLRAQQLAQTMNGPGTAAVEVRTRPDYYQPWVWLVRVGQANTVWTPINVLTGRILPPEAASSVWFPPLPGREHVRAPRN